MGGTGLGGLILDANVLIDYRCCSQRVFHSLTHVFGCLHAPSTVLEEVRNQTRADFEQRDILLIEPSLEMALDAASRDGPLSYQDWLCILLAEERGLVCVTNDRAMRRVCTDRNVPVRWGMELLCVLSQEGCMSRTAVERLLWTMQRDNPYITKELVQRALDHLDSQA